MRDVFIRVLHHRHHPSHDGAGCAEKIDQRNGQDENQPYQETSRQKEKLNRTDQFFFMREFIRTKKIEYQKKNGDDRIVDAVLQERIRGCCEETKMPAE